MAGRGSPKTRGSSTPKMDAKNKRRTRNNANVSNSKPAAETMQKATKQQIDKKSTQATVNCNTGATSNAKIVATSKSKPTEQHQGATSATVQIEHSGNKVASATNQIPIEQTKQIEQTEQIEQPIEQIEQIEHPID